MQSYNVDHILIIIQVILVVLIHVFEHREHGNSAKVTNEFLAKFSNSLSSFLCIAVVTVGGNSLMITGCAGKTRIGSGRASIRQDIVLQGPGIHDQHCYVVNHDDVVTLYPLTGQLAVDGLHVTTPTKLVQGSHFAYFRF